METIVVVSRARPRPADAGLAVERARVMALCEQPRREHRPPQFGTPGQDRFGFMWRDLVAGALGGVVLVDTGRIDESFVALDYFEQIGLPFVVTVNQFEGRENLPLDEARVGTNVEPAVPVIAVDARQKESVKAVILSLLDLVLARARSGRARP